MHGDRRAGWSRGCGSNGVFSVGRRFGGDVFQPRVAAATCSSIDFLMIVYLYVRTVPSCTPYAGARAPNCTPYAGRSRSETVPVMRGKLLLSTAILWKTRRLGGR